MRVFRVMGQFRPLWGNVVQSEGTEKKKAKPPPAPVKGQHPGTVPVLYQKIIAARQALGWSPRTLAKRAYCSLVTVKSVESGNQAFPSTIEKIGKPLGLKLTDLAPGFEPVVAVPQDASAETVVRAKLELNTSFARFDETTDLKEALLQLREKLQIKGKFTVIVVEEGSVVLTLEMDESDAEKIIQALGQGNLPGLPPVMAVAIQSAASERRIKLNPQTLDSLDELATSSTNRFRHRVFGLDGYHWASKRYRFKDKLVFWIDYHLDTVIGSKRANALHFPIVFLINLLDVTFHLARVANLGYALLAPSVYVAGRFQKVLDNAGAKDPNPATYWWFRLFVLSLVASNIANLLLAKYHRDRPFRVIMICTFLVNALMLFLYFIY